MMEPLKKPWAPAFFFWLGILLCSTALIRLWPDRGYYLLSPALRPMHPHHEFLRSSGTGGLSFGVIATLLMVVNLTYLLRKRFISISWLGSLRSWLSFHVVTGMVAGAMVLLHSAFLLRSVLGIMAFAAMAIVVVTGLIGRYIFGRTPHSVKGKELEMEEIRQDLQEYQARLESLGMPHEFFLLTAAAAPRRRASDKGLVATLLSLAAGDRELRREHKSLRRMVRDNPVLRPLTAQIMPMADRYCVERHWLARYQELRSLMGSWRFFHRWFAIVLLSAVTFHILVAAKLGNLWLVNLIRHGHH